MLRGMPRELGNERLKLDLTFCNHECAIESLCFAFDYYYYYLVQLRNRPWR